MTGDNTEYDQRRKKIHYYIPLYDVFGGIWRSFGGAAYWRVCNSLRTSRESVGEAHVNTITMTCWSRDRVALMTYPG